MPRCDHSSRSVFLQPLGLVTKRAAHTHRHLLPRHVEGDRGCAGCGPRLHDAVGVRFIASRRRDSLKPQDAAVAVLNAHVGGALRRALDGQAGAEQRDRQVHLEPALMKVAAELDAEVLAPHRARSRARARCSWPGPPPRLRPAARGCSCTRRPRLGRRQRRDRAESRNNPNVDRSREA